MVGLGDVFPTEFHLFPIFYFQGRHLVEQFNSVNGVRLFSSPKSLSGLDGSVLASVACHAGDRNSFFYVSVEGTSLLGL